MNDINKKKGLQSRLDVDSTSYNIMLWAIGTMQTRGNVHNVDAILTQYRKTSQYR
jgi:hypothetical protein